MNINEIISKVNQCAYNVRKVIPPGMLEAVYQKALMIELRDCGLSAKSEVNMQVYYKDEVIGVYRADIVVEDRLIIEIKTASELSINHDLQLVNYLQILRIDDGLLINFGDTFQIKRKFRKYKNS